MNKRGFTLVEMLGVLILLIMIFMIMFPSLTKMIKDTNEEIDTATVSIIKEATANYLSEKSDVYPKSDDYTYCITLSELIDNADLTENQISSLDNPDMIVKTTFVDNKPVYILTKTCIDITVDIDFTLIGETNMSFEVGDGGQYIEPGATALNKAGETVTYTTTITNSNKETVEYVDTTKVDIYTVKYSATIDGEDYSIERIVKVVDTTAPTITVTPTTETIAITNSTYNVLAGVTASDNSGATPTIKASTNLSLGQAGTYSITYTATDSSGNKKTARRTVIIANANLVNISLNGNKTVTVTSTSYVDEGATATDNVGTNLTSSLVETIINNGEVVSEVKVDKTATYYVTYSITKDGVTYSETRRIDIIVPPHNTLSGLTLNNGGSTISLSPGFATSILSYSTTVDSVVASVTVTPTATYSGTTIQVEGTAVSSGTSSSPIYLNSGSIKNITITVSDDDGSTQSYTIEVTRSTDNTLSDISVKSGKTIIALTQTFNSNQFTYATVNTTVLTVTITPTLVDPAASVKVNNVVVASGTASAAITLNVGINTILVEVTPQLGLKKTYTISINKTS